MVGKVWPARSNSSTKPSRQKTHFSWARNDTHEYEEVNLSELKDTAKDQHPPTPDQVRHVHDAHQDRLKPKIVSEWSLEILSLLAALASVLAVAVFLSQYHKRPKPKWPARITLNSVVSVFGLILKACMLKPVSECISQCKWLWYQDAHSLFDLEIFDQASRGLNGSFRMLFGSKTKYLGRTVAVIGAFLTICAVAIDPILQLSLTYSSEVLLVTPPPMIIPSMPISRSYSESDASGTSLVDEALLGTFYTSIISPNSSNLQVNAYCPTGQCDFNTPYESMGFCSSCENVSYLISPEFTNSTLLMILANNDTDGTVNFYNVAWLNASLPGGPMIYLGPSPEGGITAMNISSFTPNIEYMDVLRNTTFGVPLSSQPGAPRVDMYATSTTLLPFLSIGPSLASCTSDWMNGGPRYPETDCLVLSKLQSGLDPNGPTGIVGGPGALDVQVDPSASMNSEYQTTNSFPPLTLWPNLTATMCTVSLCQKSFSATVRNGTLDEKIVQETNIISLNESDSIDSIERRYVAVDCAVNGTKHSTTDYFEPNLFDQTNANVTYKNLVDSSLDRNLLDSCTYKLSNRLFETSFELLSTLCAGAGTFTGDPNKVISIEQKGSNLTTINPWGHAKYVNWQNNTHLASLYNQGNWSLTTMNQSFQQIAEALTNHLRINDINKSAADGRALDSMTVVHVYYWWLIIPALLVLSACVFLLITIRSTNVHAKDNMTWKSSQAALLYHGLHTREEELNAVVSREAMKQHARATAVKLGKEEAGWRLVRRRDTEGIEHRETSGTLSSFRSSTDELSPPKKLYDTL